MSVIEGWCPPSRENWELLTWLWQLFPLFTAIQWLTDYFPQGKTSVVSRLNLPGKLGWASMEAPGFLLLLYLMYALPKRIGLSEIPLPNQLMAALFVIHYIYRALAAPLFLNPSMSPIHPLVWFCALAFQLINSTCIAGWLAGYGPVTAEDWKGKELNIAVGVLVFLGGLLGNIYHDDRLRKIRRKASKQKSVDKVYEIPSGGLFEVVLFPHYFCEWVEWLGFWIIGGWACVPARNFLFNEVTTMLPRALSGRRWYVKKFGEDKMRNKKAVIPGVI